MTKNIHIEDPDTIPNDEIGDFAEGQETTHHSQRPNRFSEGQEATADDEQKRAIGDFATGEEKEHEHHIGSFAEPTRADRS